MPGPRFFAYARRIAAYRGMLSRRLDLQQERERKQAERATVAAPPPPGASTRPPARSTRPAAGRLPEGASVVPASVMAMQMPGLFEMRRAPKAGPSTTE